MGPIHLFALTGILLSALCFGCMRNVKRDLPDYLPAALFLAALTLRLICAALSRGFGSDTACFAAWADRIFLTGPGGFYSPEVFTDYPPGYMYLLWPVGALRSLTDMEYYSAPHLILLKAPAILCDLGCGMLLFREASRKCGKADALFLCSAYLFHPAVILNSSLWGQTDSVFTFAVACTCILLIHGKPAAAYAAFGAGVLIKPQTLLFAPLILADLAEDPAPRRLLHRLSYILLTATGVLLLCLPFGPDNVLIQYTDTLGSYPYAAVNACNLWGLLGLNWISQENTFWGIPYRVFGGLSVAAAVAAVLILKLKNRKCRENYPFYAALTVITVFLFSVRMHERYLYPALLFLLLAYSFRPSRLTAVCYGGFAALHFYNTAWVLFSYDPANYDRKSPFILIVSAGMLLWGGLLYYIAFRYYGNAKMKPDARYSDRKSPFPASAGFEGQNAPMTERFVPRPSRKKLSLTKTDIFCVSLITAVYACFALYDPGDMKAPVTGLDMVQGQSLELDFGGEKPASFFYYIAPWHGRVFSLSGRDAGEEAWTDCGEITLKNVFTWQEIRLETEVSRLKFTLTDSQASLTELVFFDGGGNRLTPVNAADYPALFDEGDLFSGVSSCRNGMYFDEIYHGRTAYEFLHGLTSYENTHPPLGKLLISSGVAVFGMNPFGWRIVGILFGIAMVPLAWLFARRIFRSTFAASLTCVLFSFDFMHFTQTRIATIDVYITFFVMLMYYFMYRYCEMSFYDTPLKTTLLPLGACGVCMGAGIAAKWTGIYAGAGLAVIFFSQMYGRYREYLYAGKNPFGVTNGIRHEHITESFLPNLRRTVYFCLLFFVAVPALIYLLSYLPFRDYSDRGLIARMLYNQKTMFDYHSSLDATHAFSSSWYEWPLILRPVWYYSRIITRGGIDTGLREGISAFGNPAVWWAGIPASLYTLYLWVRRRDRIAAFLFTGYMAQYLPWFFVTRITFIYHYFPSVIFVVLMIVYGLLHLKKKLSPGAFLTLTVLYGAVTVGLFLLFFPVLSGQPVEAAFVDKYLRWFGSWVLTAK